MRKEVKWFKDNLLAQFSVVSFAVVSALALSISITITNRLNQHIELMQSDLSDMKVGKPIKPTHHWRKDHMSQDVVKLERLVYVAMGLGFAALYVTLVFIVWRGWRTIKKQKEALLENEKELLEHRDRLEEKVQERTLRITKVNEQLQHEVAERKQVEEKLRKNKDELQLLNEELQDNQAQLVQSVKMASLGQLAAGVAHEINNPVGFVTSNLGTLTGYVTTFKQILSEYEALASAVQDGNRIDKNPILARIDDLREKEDLPFILEDIDNLLKESSDGTQRVKEIVQNLKRFARLDDAELKDSDINEGIESTLKIVWNELKYKCTVHKDLGQIPRIPCYLGQLNQVFMNLLVNAAQAIQDEGDITIKTEANDTHVIVQISDTGEGIPPEKIPNIMNPFFTTKAVRKGTGLGLSISYGIVQKHDGTIDVESEVGKGTTFTVRLPIKGPQDE